MAKSKVIIKKDLLQLMAECRKYHKAESGSVEEQIAYKEWVELCNKTFGDTMFSKKASRLKDLTRYLRDFDNKKVIKVFQALGYKVIDNWADYVRNKEKTLKEKIYSKLCSGCVMKYVAMKRVNIVTLTMEN